MTEKTYQTLATKLIHAGEARVDGAVRQPIFQSAMFEIHADDPRGSRYIRYFNTPNQVALADKLAALEGRKRRWSRVAAWPPSRARCSLCCARATTCCRSTASMAAPTN